MRRAGLLRSIDPVTTFRPMPERGRYLMLLLAVLACTLFYYLTFPEKREQRRGTAPSSSEPESAVPQVTPVQPRPQPVEHVDASSSVDAGEQTNAQDSVIQQIRDSLVTNPMLAESLVLQERDKNPDNPDGDELDALLVAAIFNQHQVDRARVEARRYFRRHPGGRYTDYLERETRMHPPPASSAN